jgi:hypothetical protein
MATLRPVVLVSALATTALNCAAPTGPSSGLVATVVAAERNSAGIVGFEVNWRNEGTIPVYLSACGGRVSMWLERRASGAWEGFGGGICLANLDQTPVRLDPNQSVLATVGVGPGGGGEYRAVTSASASNGHRWGIVRSPSAQVP